VSKLKHTTWEAFEAASCPADRDERQRDLSLAWSVHCIMVCCITRLKPYFSAAKYEPDSSGYALHSASADLGCWC